MPNETNAPTDMVTARAAFREAIRWECCEGCGVTGPDAGLTVVGGGTVTCLECAMAALVTEYPAQVLHIGSVVARAVANV